jgi:hypothetical protein
VQRRRTIKTILSLFAGLLIATAGAELVGRNIIFLSPGYTRDPVFGFRYRPGKYVFSSEGFSAGRFTPGGFRDYELPATRPDAQEAVVYGDSYTEAMQVAARQTFSHLIQEQLPQYRFNVFGLADGSLAQYIQWNASLKPRLAPKVAVFVLNSTDFTTDVTTDLRGTGRVSVTKLGPHEYESQVNTNVTNARLKSGKLADKLMCNSLPYLLAKVFLADPVRSPAVHSGSQHEPPLNEDYLDWCFERMRSAAPRVIVVYIPFMAYHRGLENEAQSLMIERYLARYTLSSEFKVINMRSAFARLYAEQYVESEGFPNTLPGYGHINEVGHLQVARAIVEGLGEQWRLRR